MWKVFSKVVKPDRTIWLNGQRTDPKALYNFHESVINALRPTMKEGVRSLILASTSRTDYTQKIIDHVRLHHAWLAKGPNKVAISQIAQPASTLSEVTNLTRTPAFKRQINETTSQETEDLIQILEERLTKTDQDTAVVYSIAEAEDLIIHTSKSGIPKPEYLMLTDKWLAEYPEKNRIQRLMQIAANRNVKTRIVPAESSAGKRLTQLGGLVCLARK